MEQTLISDCLVLLQASQEEVGDSSRWTNGQANTMTSTFALG